MREKTLVYEYLVGICFQCVKLLKTNKNMDHILITYTQEKRSYSEIKTTFI